MPTTIFHFDPQSGEYTGEMSAAKLNHDGQEMIPPKLHKSRTAEPPPEAEPGHAVCRVNGEWVQVEDNRGTKVFDKETRQGTEIKKLGVIPDTMTKDVPPDETYKHTKRGWEQDAELKAGSDKRKAEEVARDAARHRVIENFPDIAVALGWREPV